jgi:hypothetical protein
MVLPELPCHIVAGTDTIARVFQAAEGGVVKAAPSSMTELWSRCR